MPGIAKNLSAGFAVKRFFAEGGWQWRAWGPPAQNDTVGPGGYHRNQPNRVLRGSSAQITLQTESQAMRSMAKNLFVVSQSRDPSLDIGHGDSSAEDPLRMTAHA
jgi:hypothetical protein